MRAALDGRARVVSAQVEVVAAGRRPELAAAVGAHLGAVAQVAVRAGERVVGSLAGAGRGARLGRAEVRRNGAGHEIGAVRRDLARGAKSEDGVRPDHLALAHFTGHDVGAHERLSVDPHEVAGNAARVGGAVEGVVAGSGAHGAADGSAIPDCDLSGGEEGRELLLALKRRELGHVTARVGIVNADPAAVAGRVLDLADVGAAVELVDLAVAGHDVELLSLELLLEVRGDIIGQVVGLVDHAFRRGRLGLEGRVGVVDIARNHEDRAENGQRRRRLGNDVFQRVLLG